MEFDSEYTTVIYYDTRIYDSDWFTSCSELIYYLLDQYYNNSKCFGCFITPVKKISSFSNFFEDDIFNHPLLEYEVIISDIENKSLLFKSKDLFVLVKWSIEENMLYVFNILHGSHYNIEKDKVIVVYDTDEDEGETVIGDDENVY